MSSTPPPLVLGAGVAGLAAAVELARRGLRPIVLESRPFVGGRARSFVHDATGEEIDNGQHLMMGCYHATFRLLELIGTRDLVDVQPRLRVEYRDADGTPDRLAASTLIPSPFDVLSGMLRLERLSLSERLGLLRVARWAMRRRASSDVDESVTSLLGRLRQSARAIERVWDPIVVATMNTPSHEASAALFGEVLRRAFLGGAESSRLAIPRVGLSRLFAPAVEFITSRGGAVELGASVTRIEHLNDRHSVHAKNREPIDCRELVVALPPRQASTLLSGGLGIGPFDDALALSPIVSLYLWLDRAVDGIPELTALLGTSVQWVFNRRTMVTDVQDAAARRSAPGLLACTISAADAESALDAGAMTARAELELRRAFPELDGARVVDALVIKEKHATFRATPGIDAVRPPTRSALAGLYLAGDWTATRLPATIEGAAQSGFAAAEALFADRR